MCQNRVKNWVLQGLKITDNIHIHMNGVISDWSYTPKTNLYDLHIHGNLRVSLKQKKRLEHNGSRTSKVHLKLAVPVHILDNTLIGLHLHDIQNTRNTATSSQPAYYNLKGFQTAERMEIQYALRDIS